MLSNNHQCLSKYKIKLIQRDNAPSLEDLCTSNEFKEIIKKILLTYNTGSN